MKNLNLLCLLTALLLLTAFACKKDDDEDVNPDGLYIVFDLDGEKVNISGTTNSINTGFGVDVTSSSGFFDFVTNISIELSMDGDSITGETFQSLVGQKIKVPTCYGEGCGTGIDLDYYIGSDYYSTFSEYNAFPEYYFEITQVDFHQKGTPLDPEVEQYILKGVFNVRISSGQDVKEATNGRFRLIFQESWF